MLSSVKGGSTWSNRLSRFSPSWSCARFMSPNWFWILYNSIAHGWFSTSSSSISWTFRFWLISSRKFVPKSDRPNCSTFWFVDCSWRSCDYRSALFVRLPTRKVCILDWQSAINFFLRSRCAVFLSFPPRVNLSIDRGPLVWDSPTSSFTWAFPLAWFRTIGVVP